MTVSLKHKFTSAKSDSADASLIRPSNWNDEHDLTLATDRLLGRDTTGTGAAEEITVAGGLEFTGTGGIQRSALTGDVTASAGSNTTTIANDTVTYAKIQNVSTNNRILGRSTAGAGDIEELSVGTGLTLSSGTLSVTSNTYQPLDADLTAIATLAGTSGFLRKTAADTWSLDTSTYLTTATAASSYQPLDADLTAIAGLAVTDGNVIVGNGTTWVAESGATARTSLGAAASGAVTSSGLTQATSRMLGRTTAGSGAIEEISVGTGLTLSAGSLSVTASTYQPLDSELSALAGLVSAADRLPYFTGSGTAALATFTTAGRNLIDDADTAAQRATLGLVIGTNVQAWDPDLDAIGAIAGTSGLLRKTAANTWSLDTTSYANSTHTHSQSDITNLTTDLAAKAPLASPALTGTPTAPTAAANTNTTQLATTAFVIGQANSTAATIAMNGTQAAGSSTLFARADHVHPVDTSRAPLASPAFTGTPTAPSAAAYTDTTQIATTANVYDTVTTVPENAQTGTSYTLVLGDAGKMVTLSNTAAITLSIPTNATVAFPNGTRIDILQYNTGQVTVGGSGVTILSSGSKLKLAGRYSGATLWKKTTNTWLLIGDLTA